MSVSVGVCCVVRVLCILSVCVLSVCVFSVCEGVLVSVCVRVWMHVCA